MSGTVPHRFGPYGGQYVPETLMPALTELEAAWIEAASDAVFRLGCSRCSTITSDGRPRCISPNASVSGSDIRSTSSARTSTTPALTRSTTRLGRRCWPSAWARPGSSLETGAGRTRCRQRHRVCVAGPRVHRLHGHGGHPPPEAPTCSAWSSWEPPWWASMLARGRSRKRSRLRSATGSPTSATPTTSSAHAWARLRIR